MLTSSANRSFLKKINCFFRILTSSSNGWLLRKKSKGWIDLIFRTFRKFNSSLERYFRMLDLFCRRLSSFSEHSSLFKKIDFISIDGLLCLQKVACFRRLTSFPGYLFASLYICRKLTSSLENVFSRRVKSFLDDWPLLDSIRNLNNNTKVVS